MLELVVDHNGSERHKRCKRQVANVFRAYGGTAAGDKDDEFALTTDTRRFPLYLDIVAVLGERVFAVEIDGYKGHKTGLAIKKDKNRMGEIRDAIKDIECYRFAFWQLKGTEDHIIAQELGIG